MAAAAEAAGGKAKGIVTKGAKSVLVISARHINDAVSFLVFSLLDIIDFILCYLFKVADLFIEADSMKPCYCSSRKEAAVISTNHRSRSSCGGGKILNLKVGGGESTTTTTHKIVCLTSGSAASTAKLRLEDVSDTLYSRPSLVSELSSSTVKELRRLKTIRQYSSSYFRYSKWNYSSSRWCTSSSTSRTTLTVNSTIMEMLQQQQGKIIGRGRGKVDNNSKQEQYYYSPSPSATGHPPPAVIPRWSDCDCRTCTGWISSSPSTLFVQMDGAAKLGLAGSNINGTTEDVLFIHGFISSSKFWTETIFPNLSSSVKSKYRLFAVDLLGFGRSPKPMDSLYTLQEHVEMIERSVMEAHRVKSLHIVAHSLGCILALALAVKHPGSVKSLTLLAPPYFGVPNGEELRGISPNQYVMRSLGPRRVWPLITFGASIACWYEHISRAACLVFCKHHRMWQFLISRASGDRIKSFLLEGFWCHTHTAAWHTLHNVICGTANKMDGYLDAVRDCLRCDVTVFHGREDQLIPVDCSRRVQSKIPRARLKLVDRKDHITIVVGRQKAFARELEDIWRRASSSSASC